MFGIILITAGTIMHLYVLWRALSVPFIARRAGRTGLVAGGIVLWLLFVIGRTYGHESAGAVATVVETAGMIWLAILFLLSTALLAVDAVTGFGLLLPAYAPRMRGAALVLGVALSAIALVQGARAPVVTTYDVELPGLPSHLDGTVIIGLSDLHLGSLRDEHWLGARVSQVQGARPDLIVLLGDIFEGHGRPPRELAAGLAKLQAPLGVWAVLGNHEFHGRDNGISELFRDAGITVLRNERAQVRPGLLLAGVDDLTSNHRNGSRTDLVAATLVQGSPGATVLLSHTPWSADRAAQAGAGLMLSGHTHGGQIWPFGYLVRRFYPLLAGRYDVDGMTVIVSRGAGLWGPPMRLWRPGEIIQVTLKAQKRGA